MAKDGSKVFIVYFSPAGSTRHVARLMEKRFRELGVEPLLFDLAEGSGLSQVISEQGRQLPHCGFSSLCFSCGTAHHAVSGRIGPN